MNQQTIDMLTEMKMTAMAAEFANQIQNASFNSIGFEERLSMLVTAEWNRRQNNKVAWLMRNAEFGIPSMRIANWIRHSFCGLLPTSTLMKATTLYWKAPPVMARLTSPARWVMLRAEG